MKVLRNPTYRKLYKINRVKYFSLQGNIFRILKNPQKYQVLFENHSMPREITEKSGFEGPSVFRLNEIFPSQM